MSGVSLARRALSLLVSSLTVLLALPAGAFAARVSAGGNHSLWIADDGLMWAVGYNTDGQLGDGTKTSRTAPVAVGYFNDWTTVEAGYVSSYGLRRGGSLWAWGDNAYGQLGVGTTTDATRPLRVSSPATFTAVAAGLQHALAIRSDGTLWAWGRNGHGQLGIGTRETKTRPVRVGTDSDWVAVWAGGNFSAGMRADGSTWIWGCDYDGQLARSDTRQWYEYEHAAHDITTPVLLSGSGVVDALFLGGYHALARWAPGTMSAGTLTSWGSNRFGQLGNGEQDVVRDTSPGAILGGTTYALVAPGAFHTLALRTDGILEAWGRNDSGQCGTGSTASTLVQPSVVPSITGVADLAGGESHSLALVPGQSALWGWGSDAQGQLALSGAGVWRTPRRITSTRLAYLGTPSAPSSIRLGTRITVTGTLLPRHTASVKVYVYRWNGKSWVLKAGPYTRALSLASTYPVWSLAYRPSSRGTWSVRAAHADAQHLTSWSPRRTFTVK